MERGFSRLLAELGRAYPALAPDELCALIAAYAQNYDEVPGCVRQILFEQNLRQILSRGLGWEQVRQRVAHALGLKVSNRWAPAEAIGRRLGNWGRPLDIGSVEDWWNALLLDLLAHGAVQVRPGAGVIVDYRAFGDCQRRK